METNKEESTELVLIGKKELTALSKFKVELNKFVEENPFIEVVDKKTAKIAEQRLSNLRLKRLTIRTTGKGESQEKILKARIEQLKSFIISEIDVCEKIVLTPEEKQKKSLDEWEKEEERKAEIIRKAEEERKATIAKKIEEVETELSKVIQECEKYEDVEEKQKEFLSLSESLVKDFDFKEFKSNLETMIDDKADELQSKIDELKLKFEKDEADKLRIKAELKSKRMERLIDYLHKYKGEKDLGDLTDDEFTEELSSAIMAYRSKELIEMGFIYDSERAKFVLTYEGSEIAEIADETICDLCDEEWESEKLDIGKMLVAEKISKETNWNDSSDKNTSDYALGMEVFDCQNVSEKSNDAKKEEAKPFKDNAPVAENIVKVVEKKEISTYSTLKKILPLMELQEQNMFVSIIEWKNAILEAKEALKMHEMNTNKN